jgi:hypothetical protein
VDTPRKRAVRKLYVQKYEVKITTDENGDGVGYTPMCNGRVLEIRYIKSALGGYAAGVDIDVTVNTSGVVVWSEDAVNASKTVCPRQITHTTAGVDSTELTHICVGNDRIKIVVDDGGDGGVGTFVVLVG